MQEISTRVRSAYDEWAPTYDSARNPTRDLNSAVLREQPFDPAGKSVLEIGCGTGLNTGWLAQAEHVLAVDFSRGMLHRARIRVTNDNVRFVEGDITEPWRFVEGLFDLIVANLILEHIRDLGHIFAEAYKAAAPGGLFYIGELHPYKQMLGTQARYLREEKGEEVRVDAVRHTLSEFVNEALGAGFRLDHLGEHMGEGDTIPRLLTLRFIRPQYSVEELFDRPQTSSRATSSISNIRSFPASG
jgi:malonyl-CoA O-methyltransferase